MNRLEGWARGIAAGAAACLMAASFPASAQQAPDPLRFLRPWLEQQLGVAGEPAEGAADDQSGAAAPSPPAADAAAPGAPAPPAPSVAPESAAGPPAPPPPAGNPDGPEAPPLPTPSEVAQPPAPADPAPLVPAAETVAAEPAPAAEDVEPPPAPLRLGVLAGRDVMATMRAISPVPAALTQRLGRSVELLPLSSYGAMMDAQAQRRIDGGFYSASAFALAQANCRCLEPIVAPAAADGSLSYYAIIVARADSGIASLAGLQGKTVAIGPQDSVGSRRMQLAGLLAEGVDPSGFGGVREVDSADEAVRLVASGAADAAFAWSSMSGDPQTGYSRGTLTDLVARGELTMGQIAVIWRSAPIMHGPFAVLKTLPEEDKADIEAYLLSLEASQPAAYDALNPFYSGGYAAVEPADYAGLDVLTAQNVDALVLPVAPIAVPPPASVP